MRSSEGKDVGPSQLSGHCPVNTQTPGHAGNKLANINLFATNLFASFRAPQPTSSLHREDRSCHFQARKAWPLSTDTWHPCSWYLLLWGLQPASSSVRTEAMDGAGGSTDCFLSLKPTTQTWTSAPLANTWKPSNKQNKGVGEREGEKWENNSPKFKIILKSGEETRLWLRSFENIYIF